MSTSTTTPLPLISNESEWQEILIGEVRNRRCLWDKSHKDYKDSRTVKNNHWIDITRVLNQHQLVTNQLATTESEWTGTNL